MLLIQFYCWRLVIDVFNQVEPMYIKQQRFEMYIVPVQNLELVCGIL